MESKVIYDALSFTVKVESYQDEFRKFNMVLDLLGLKLGPEWQKFGSTGKGYLDRWYCEGISIHVGGRSEIWVEMSGTGCRYFESFGTGNYEQIFHYILDNQDICNITRLDVAFDDHEGILDMDQLCSDTMDQEYVSKFKAWEVRIGSGGQSVNHGSMTSEVYLRIYDKAKERKYTDGRHWIRVEFQLRRERALAFINLKAEIGVKFCEVLHGYLRYVQPSECDSNRWRWELKPYWAKLLQTAGKISLYEAPGVDYNKENLDTFVGQTHGALWTTVQLEGKDKIAMLDTPPAHLNPKYQRLIDISKKGGVEGNPLSTQQNKNFVELEGDENGVNRLNASFGLILLRMAQLLADSHNCVIQFTRFRSHYEFPN